MRKFRGRYVAKAGVLDLQCGRIYKDAEIFGASPRLSNFAHNLQCGRIYKDAEIRRGHRRRGAPARAFNVAASIKMRK